MAMVRSTCLWLWVLEEVNVQHAHDQCGADRKGDELSCCRQSLDPLYVVPFYGQLHGQYDKHSHNNSQKAVQFLQAKNARTAIIC